MRIGKPEIRVEGKSAIYTVPLVLTDGEAELRYEIPAQFGDMISQTADAAAVAMLIPAMSAGTDIEIAGRLSERLYYNLRGPYQQVLRKLQPQLSLIHVRADQVEKSTGHGDAVLTGFSVGIDSFAVMLDHHYREDVPPGYRITHLLFNHTGSHHSYLFEDDEAAARMLFRERLERAKAMAERLRLPLIPVVSNIRDFYGQLPYVTTHTPRNVSVALMLSGGAERFLYASAYEFGQLKLSPNETSAIADPVTLPMLSTEAIDCLSAVAGYTRVEKTLRVAELPDAWAHLDICTRPRTGAFHNCGSCVKCERMLATLDIAGLLDRFANVFDLEAYGRDRDRILASLSGSADPFAVEIAAFAASRGLDLPAPEAIASAPGSWWSRRFTRKLA